MLVFMQLRLTEMNILNLGNIELIEYCSNFLESFLIDKGYCIKKLENFSRLTWKNIVYKAILSDGDVYSIKLVLNCNEPARRFNSEIKINDVFNSKATKSFCICLYNEEFVINDGIIYAVLIRKWAEGTSYMQLLKNDFDNFVNLYLPSIKHCCEDVWKLNNIEFTPIISNITRYGLIPDLLFQKNYGNSGFASFLSKAYLDNKPTNNDCYVINSDFSLHEFIITETGKLIIIDWEDISIGNKIIDIAGIYYSIFQHISQIFDFDRIMRFTKHYVELFELPNINDFIYYFIERIVMADYLTESLNDNILKFAPKVIHELEKQKKLQVKC